MHPAWSKGRLASSRVPTEADNERHTRSRRSPFTHGAITCTFSGTFPGKATSNLLHLRTLGGLSLERDGRALGGAAGQRARLAILAIIASSGDKGISRERLQSLFWPENDADRARGALNQAMYVLRRDAGEPALIAGNAELRLNTSVVACDLIVFRERIAVKQWEEAIHWYGGAFLDGVSLRGSAELDGWVEQERQAIAALHRDAIRNIAMGADTRGDTTGAVQWWKRLAAEEPLSAATATALMRAHVANDDRGAALLHAQVYASLVRQELEAEPDPALVRLEGAIRSATGGGHGDGNNGGKSPSSRSASTSPESARKPDESTRGDSSARGDTRASAPSGTPARAGESPSITSTHRRTTLVRARAKRAAATAGLIVALAASMIAWRMTSAREIPRGVAVVSGDDAAFNGSIVMYEVFRARLASGVAETGISDLVLVPGNDRRGAGRMSRRTLRAENPRFIVTPSIRLDGDSLLVGVRISDAVAGLDVPSVELQRAPRSEFEGAVRILRSRVMAALASRVDPIFEGWGYAAALPSNWESLRELRLGIEAHRRGQFRVALGHFTASATLDSVSSTPLVWAARVSDSVASAAIESRLEGSSLRSGAWDQAMLDFVRVSRQADPYATHMAAHRVLATAPGSEFVLLLAQTAMSIGRADEVVRLLHDADRDDVLTFSSLEFRTTLASAHHFLGEFREELAVANAGLLQNPNDRILMQVQVRALSGLGHYGQVAQICKRSLRYTPRSGWEWQPCEQAVTELRAHGHPAEARRLALQVLRESGAVAESPAFATDSVVWLLDAGDFETLGRVLDASRADSTERHVDWVIGRSLLAAWRGDRAALATIMHWRDSLRLQYVRPGEESIFRAQQAALLGDKGAAAAWTARALREGFVWRQVLHIQPGLDRLRGYPPFEAHLAPVDEPELPAAAVARVRGRG